MKIFKKITLILTFCLVLVSLAPASFASAKVKKKTVTLYVGEKYSIKLKGSTKKYKIKWTTSKKKILKIVGKSNKAKCKFKALKKGKSVVRLKINGKVYYKYTFKVKKLKTKISDEPAMTENTVSESPSVSPEIPSVEPSSEVSSEPEQTASAEVSASATTAPVIDLNPSEPSVSEGPQYSPSTEPSSSPDVEEEIEYRTYQKTVSVYDEQALTSISTQASVDINKMITDFSGGNVVSDNSTLSLPNHNFTVNSAYAADNFINEVFANNVCTIKAFVTEKDELFNDSDSLWNYSSNELYLGLNVTSMACDKKVHIVTGKNYISVLTTEIHDLKNTKTGEVFDVTVYSYDFYCNGFAIKSSSTDKSKVDNLASVFNDIIA